MNGPNVLNFELTTECPLRCPQCYCTLNTGKHLDLNVAYHWIEEAAICGVKSLNLSGGETMCYPHLFDVIKRATQKGLACNVALSGYLFDANSFKQLLDAGVEGIFISLNGSTDEINRRSRNGYRLAISALEILKKAKFDRTTINWVMQSSNSDDFEAMIALAEEYCVSRLVVLGLKPDSENDLSKRPSAEQMKYVSQVIRNYKGPVSIRIESCFSPMLALTSQSYLFGNTNRGIEKGCPAGYLAASVNVDGLLSPCRHLYHFEKWDSLNDYWSNSTVLNQIRLLEDCRKAPCNSCKFGNYCRHCLAINDNVLGELFLGDKNCPLATC